MLRNCTYRRDCLLVVPLQWKMTWWHGHFCSSCELQFATRRYLDNHGPLQEDVRCTITALSLRLWQFQGQSRWECYRRSRPLWQAPAKFWHIRLKQLSTFRTVRDPSVGADYRNWALRRELCNGRMEYSQPRSMTLPARLLTRRLKTNRKIAFHKGLPVARMEKSLRMQAFGSVGPS